MKMPDTIQLTPPPVQWAQRKNLVYLSVCVEDCKNPDIKLHPDKLYFRSKGGVDQKEYEVTINLFQEIIPEDSKYVVRDRLVEFILRKKIDGPFWKRLVKEDKKFHWLKVDFDKWRDEDDSDEEYGNNQDLEDMFKQMGGLGDSGDKDIADLDKGNEEDSDDEEIPDLE